jgi:hypothetical protein
VVTAGLRACKTVRGKEARAFVLTDNGQITDAAFLRYDLQLAAAELQFVESSSG